MKRCHITYTVRCLDYDVPTTESETAQQVLRVPQNLLHILKFIINLNTTIL